MHITWLNIFLLALELWRISSLFANEDGPFHFFRKFRDYCKFLCEHNRFCRELHLYELIECEWCNSVWFGTLLTLLWFLYGDRVIVILLPFALSTLVIVLKYIIQGLEKLNTLLEAEQVERNRTPW